MTGPEKISIGGISFYKNDVKEYQVKNKGNESINTVFMKDGTKVEYFDQSPDKKASIMMGYDMAKNNTKGIKFSNCNLHSLTGTPNKDYYYMDKTSTNKFDLGGDEGNADELKFVYRDKNKPELVIPRPGGLSKADYDDKIIKVNLDKEQYINMNEGFWLRPEDK